MIAEIINNIISAFTKNFNAFLDIINPLVFICSNAGEIRTPVIIGVRTVASPAVLLHQSNGF